MCSKKMTQSADRESTKSRHGREIHVHIFFFQDFCLILISEFRSLKRFLFLFGFGFG